MSEGVFSILVQGGPHFIVHAVYRKLLWVCFNCNRMGADRTQHNNAEDSSQKGYFYYQETNKAYANDNGVICGGEVAIYNGTRYEKRTAPQTRVTYPGRAAVGTSKEVMALLDENGGYPVTAAGESYGRNPEMALRHSSLRRV